MKTAREILADKDRDMITVSPTTTIQEAVSVMVDNTIGAILVEEAGRIVGIWTERDLLKLTARPDFDVKRAQIKDYMITDLISAPADATIYQLQDKHLGRRLRHLLIEDNGRYIGILSAGDVMRAVLQEKIEELENLNGIVRWDYYEEWKWKKKNA